MARICPKCGKMNDDNAWRCADTSCKEIIPVEVTYKDNRVKHKIIRVRFCKKCQRLLNWNFHVKCPFCKGSLPILFFAATVTEDEYDAIIKQKTPYEPYDGQDAGTF